ncbi:cation:proton antiporter [Mariniplasma anaerobium]|uniref:Cation:proton antiporter n=1 Tax=Mariniplasma anaerobium TaxID=2735436 RepID=A0A7U9XUZ3_9MOLU|nr:cation:proton antiporter [Mariniplasma anaerobium]BCR35720.1 cation:proton antiporter [Mariniplasma anaerobium]
MIEVMDIVVFSLMGFGILFTLVRMIKGPKLSDRVVSLDTFNMIVIGVIVVLASVFKSSLYLDIAIVYAILAFLETVVFSRYLEGKNYGNN